MVDWKIFHARELVTVQKLMNDKNIEVKMQEDKPVVEVKLWWNKNSIEFGVEEDGSLSMDIWHRIGYDCAQVLEYLLHRYGLLFYNDIDVDLQEVLYIENECSEFLTDKETIGYLLYRYGICSQQYIGKGVDGWLDKLIEDNKYYYAYCMSVFEDCRNGKLKTTNEQHDTYDEYQDVPECYM